MPRISARGGVAGGGRKWWGRRSGEDSRCGWRLRHGCVVFAKRQLVSASRREGLDLRQHSTRPRFERIDRIPASRNLLAVSPSTLRRYRAERLLRQEFGGLREEVLRKRARAAARPRGAASTGGDLEACYAQAWQGLYAAIAAGEEIANPAGWLTVVTFRRAIDEHRSAPRRSAGGAGRGRARPRGGARRPRAAAPAVRGAARPPQRARVRSGESLLPAGPHARAGRRSVWGSARRA